jgi:hypothetical protein
VTFSFGAGSGYLVSGGISCGTIQIDRLDGAGGTLTLGLGEQVVCEGPAPQPPSIDAAVAISGGTASLQWDARELTTFYGCVNCADRGWPGLGWVQTLEAVAQPVDAGPVPPPPGGNGTFQPLCTASRTVSVEFDLPASGDLQVAVPAQ